MSEKFSRRTIMQLVATGGAVSLTQKLSLADDAAGATASSSLNKGDVILLQGDSITDAGRDRNRQNEPNDLAALGTGYARMIATRLMGDDPYKELKIYNRGIGGHKVPDLAARWQADCLDLKPDLLSILIGVNDIWHTFYTGKFKYNGTVADYEKGYTKLIAATRAALPDVRLVICEPFVLRTGNVNDKWFPQFDQRRAVAKSVAEACGATFVPYQSMFDEAIKHAPPSHWARDGVHPTTAGAALMAAYWMSVVKP